MDIVTEHITVLIDLPISPTEGKRFSKSFSTPDALWNFLADLARRPVEVLKQEFNYTGPKTTRPKTHKPASDIRLEGVDLDKLLDRLQGFE